MVTFDNLRCHRTSSPAGESNQGIKDPSGVCAHLPPCDLQSPVRLAERGMVDRGQVPEHHIVAGEVVYSCLGKHDMFLLRRRAVPH